MNAEPVRRSAAAPARETIGREPDGAASEDRRREWIGYFVIVAL